jgi:Fe-S cluster assembly protein SufD
MAETMSSAKENPNSLLSEYESVKRARGQEYPGWLQSIKQSALDRFVSLGFPTTRSERWKYTNVAPIAKSAFKLAPNSLDLPVKLIDESVLSRAGGRRLVFVNGHYSGRLSNLEPQAGSTDGVVIGSLAQLLKSDDVDVKSHLTRYADYSDQAFTALNTAFLDDGAFIHIPDRKILEEPLYVIYWSDVGNRDALDHTTSHPRTLILAGESSQAAVVEAYLGFGDHAYFTNAVTEIVAGENSILDHYRLQQEADAAFHISTLQVQQRRNSSFYSHSISLGGALVRNDVNVVLDGEGAECTLDGLYVESGEQHVDNHTLIDHAKPHGSSRELYKGILDGKSTGVFNGSVIVRKDAQKTDARQSNKNLLLSEEAEINTKPQLEIFADDVKCTHGATIGQMDPEAMFYLQSRGIDRDAARALLMYAFSNEIIDRIKPEPVRSLITAAVFSRLSLESGASEDL